MTPAQLLSPEQQEALMQALRANNRLERIWSLYATILAHESSPNYELILERAERAVDVWMEFDDANRIDTSKITTESTAFLGQLMEQMKRIGQKGKRRGTDGAKS